MQQSVSPQEYHRQCLLAAYSSRLNPSALDPREGKLLDGWVLEKLHADYLAARNGILRLWTRNPLVSVTREEAISCVKSTNQYNLALVAHEWLARHGYINFGCVEISGQPRLVSPSSKSKTIVVIGAGVAGLACARQIESISAQFRDRWDLRSRQALPRIIILEGRGRVGGRVYSHPLASQHPGSLPHGLANTAEMGAQIITGFDSGNPLDAVVRGQLALEHHFLRDKMLLYDFNGTLIDDEQRDARMDKLFNTVLEIASKHSWKIAQKVATEQLPPRDHNTNSLKVDGVNGNNGTIKLPKTLGSMMDELVEQYQRDVKLTPLDLRLLNWHYANLEYANAANVNQLSLGGWDQDGGNEFEGRHSQVVGGYSQLPRGLWKHPTELDVRFNKAVADVTYHPEGALGSMPKATVTCEDGDTLHADYVVSTLPLGVLQERTVSFNPPLPDWKTGAMQRLGFGLLNKVILVFNHVFWDVERDMFGRLNEAASGLVDSMKQKDYSSNRGKFYLFWNCVKTSGRPMLVALMAGDAARATEETSDEAIIADVLEKLKDIFRLEIIPNPLEVIVTRWKKDRFAKGSYSYMGPTALPGDYDAMAQPVENIFFAGEATYATHPATVHGAYLSGLRAASQVIEALIGPIPVPKR